MALSVTVIPPQLRFNLLNQAGNVVTPPEPPFQRLVVSAEEWALVQCTPTNTTSSVDFVNGTSSNMGTPVVDKRTGNSIDAGKLFAFTAGSIDSPAANLLDNIIIAQINSVPVGRIAVDASTQQVSWHCEPLPDDRVDSRFTLTGVNDLTFVMSQVDPNLKIWALVMGDAN